ncbi:UPF0365 family protein [Candidatus Poribacteria bacterium]|nr:UPF0365 family protein [Candidatus Poribacteria bacterium]
MEGIGALIGIAAVLIFFFIIFIIWLVPVGLWISALAANVKVRIFGDLVAMRLRRVPPAQIVRPQIIATKAGLNLNLGELEAHFLAGGHVDNVVEALIAADKARIPLTFERAAAIDLAGRDVLEAVQMSVEPRIIDIPDPKSKQKGITGVARDGIQLITKARVTVRANIEKLVGGAGEETIIARVGEGIVTTIGSAENHKRVLENPNRISKTVLDKGLSAGTAFEILSIDIADVDVGDNVGARLQKDQAQAELKIARAKAEEKRAMAVAQEAEMKARVQEMQANLVEAEAEVPLAMAEAFQIGKLSIMDYYNMKNIIADTDMRRSISGADIESQGHGTGLA